MVLGELLEPALQDQLWTCMERLLMQNDASREGNKQTAIQALVMVLASAADTLTPAELKGAFTELAGMEGLPTVTEETDQLVQQIR